VALGPLEATGRRYTIGKRTMLPVHPRLYFQRRLQI
jgi:hypothetical protein